MPSRVVTYRAKIDKWWRTIQKQFSSSDSKKDVLTILSITGVLVIFFSKSFLTTYMHGDFIAYAVPHFKFILQSLQSGVLPYWFPYSYLGLPELFKLELGLFYPPVWVLLFLNLVFNPGLDFNGIGKSLELLQYFNVWMGAVGMYVLLRRFVQLRAFPSFFGSIVFSLSLYTTVQLVDLVSLPGKLYFPWIVLILLSFLRDSGFRNYALLVGINVLIFAFGYPYYYLYFLLAQLSLAAFYGLRKVLLVGLALGNGLLLSGFFLLPNLHILNESGRGIISTIDDPLFHTRYAYIPTKIINILNPQVFSSLYDPKDPQLLFSLGMLSWGIFPLLFLIFGFARITFTKFNTWLIIIFIFGFLISLGGYLNVPQFLGTFLPMVEKFRSHTQMLILPFFAGVIILSQGVQTVLEGVTYKKIMFFFWQIAVILLLYLLTLPFFCKDCTSDMNDIVVSLSRVTALVIVSLLLIHLTLRSKRSIFVIVGLVLTLFEFSYYYSNVPYAHMPDSFSDYYRQNSLLVEYPTKENLFRYSFTENQFMYNASFYGIFNAQGYETVPYSAIYSLSRFSEEIRHKFTNTKYIVTTEKDKQQSIPSLRLIKTIVPKEHPNEAYFGTVEQKPYFSRQRDNTYYIYEVLGYYPRFFTPRNVLFCPDTFCHTEDPMRVSYTKNQGVAMKNPPSDQIDITVEEYTPNEIRLIVMTPSDAVITSSEIWDSGWQLFNNGVPTELYNANEGFRAFRVHKGENDIVMTYFPPYVTEGTIISVCGAILLAGYFYGNRKFAAPLQPKSVRKPVKKQQRR